MLASAGYLAFASRPSLPITEQVAQSQSDKPSIAVLAFRNLSGDPEREYFADGMVEGIITTLSRVPDFLVVARNSSYSYKGRPVDGCGRSGVNSVYATSWTAAFVIAGNTLRISCVLIDAEQVESTSGLNVTTEPWRTSSICKTGSRRASSPLFSPRC